VGKYSRIKVGKLRQKKVKRLLAWKKFCRRL